MPIVGEAGFGCILGADFQKIRRNLLVDELNKIDRTSITTTIDKVDLEVADIIAQNRFDQNTKKFTNCMVLNIPEFANCMVLNIPELISLPAASKLV